jgi:Zn-dependent protease with chaperone function
MIPAAMRKLILAALVVGVATVAVVALASPAAGAPASPPAGKAASRRLEPRVTPEMLRHSRLQDILYFINIAYTLAALVLLLRSRASAKMRDLAERAIKSKYLSATLYVVLLVLALTIIELPLTIYEDYIVPHQFDLTSQTLPSWIADQAKELAVSLVVSAIVGGLVLLAIRRVRRWWIAAWLGSIPLILLGVLITPLVIDPLFNKFEPLRDPVLRRDLIAEASRAGIENSRVYEVNKSKQTKTMNAYVTGIGPTARIVMWDTLLQKLDHDEILAVMGHEMGHYVEKHLWKGIAFSIALSFFVFAIGQQLYERGLARWGSRWSVREERGDPAALPWLLALSTAITFLLSPVTSGFSRHVEHQADIFSLELTHLNEPLASAFVKFAEDSKADPRPPRFIEWWRYSHPSLGRRIDFVLAYKPKNGRISSY